MDESEFALIIINGGSMQDNNPYGVDFPEIAIEKIQNDFDQKLKTSIQSSLKKAIEDARAEIENEYYSKYSDNLEYYLNDLVLQKAKALVVGLLEGDEKCLKHFIDFGYSRKQILESVVDYTAKKEIEELKKDNKRLSDNLEYYRTNRY